MIKLILISVGILLGIVFLGFVSLQIFFNLAKKWKDKDVL